MHHQAIRPELINAIRLRMRQRPTPPAMTERLRFRIECSGLTDVFPEVREPDVVAALWKEWQDSQRSARNPALSSDRS